MSKLNFFEAMLMGSDSLKTELKCLNIYKKRSQAIVLFSYNRHFSHVTKSRIFKDLNLRRKADRNFQGNLL